MSISEQKRHHLLSAEIGPVGADGGAMQAGLGAQFEQGLRALSWRLLATVVALAAIAIATPHL